MMSFLRLLVTICRWFLSLVVEAVSRTQIPTGQSKVADDFSPARVPYVCPTPGTHRIADDFRARRNGSLLALDGVLLNSGSIARAWNDMGGAIREKLSIPEDMRELMILRVAVLNNAAYEWMQHEKPGRAAGLTTEQLLEIRMTPAFGSANHESTLSGDLLAAMSFTDYMTEKVHVPNVIFDNIKKHLSSKQIVEATATVGFYNFVSRFLVTLDVDGKMYTSVPIPE